MGLSGAKLVIDCDDGAAEYGPPFDRRGTEKNPDGNNGGGILRRTLEWGAFEGDANLPGDSVRCNRPTKMGATAVARVWPGAASSSPEGHFREGPP